MRSYIEAMRHLVVVAFAALACPGALAQTDTGSNYPHRVVKIVLPYQPGSGTDLLARIVAEKLGPRLGQPVIVENRAGASGLIGTQFVSNAPPDGYTLMMAPPTHIITAVLRKTPYDPIANFEPVMQIARSSVLVVTHPSVPVKTLKELVVYLKAQGDNATYASAGVGSALHLYTAAFQRAAGTNMRHVPGKSVGTAVMDVVQKQVTMAIVSVEAAAPMLKAGKLKAIAQMTKVRSPQLPDVPTFAEAGFPNLNIELWYGLLVPAGTPGPLIARLHKELSAILSTPEVKSLISTIGADVVAGTPEQFGALLKDEFSTWSELVKRAGIQAE